MNDDLLAVYLQNHLAGALATNELARRMYETNAGTEFGRWLGDHVRELEVERRELRQIIDTLGFEPSRLKMGTAWLGEKVGRLGLKGQLSGYSMLGRVVEVESLWAAVQTRLGLWRTLQAIVPDYPQLERFDLRGFEEQARLQLERVERLHEHAIHSVSQSGRPEQAGRLDSRSPH
jgi:hypothetical protein